MAQNSSSEHDAFQDQPRAALESAAASDSLHNSALQAPAAPEAVAAEAAAPEVASLEAAAPEVDSLAALSQHLSSSIVSPVPARQDQASSDASSPQLSSNAAPFQNASLSSIPTDAPVAAAPVAAAPVAAAMARDESLSPSIAARRAASGPHFSRLARRLSGPLRRVCGRGVREGRAWLDPDLNPFLQLALRLETRRAKPLSTVLGTALLAALLLFGAARLWTFWIARGAPGSTGFARGGKLPSWLGDDLLGMAAILVLAACAYGALWASRTRSAVLLRREMLKGTLDQLQLLPIAEERWLWRMSTHVTLLSLLIGACGLPMYVLAIACGQWSPLDLVGLLLVFIALGHVAPVWQPQVWQGNKRPGQARAQIRRAESPRFNWAGQQATDERRDETVVDAVSSDSGSSDSGSSDSGAVSNAHDAPSLLQVALWDAQAEAQRLETQRRTVRALSDFNPSSDARMASASSGDSASTHAASANRNPLFGAKKSKASDAAATSASGATSNAGSSVRGGGNWSWGLLWFGVQFFNVAMRLGPGPMRMLGSLGRGIVAGLPPPARGLIGPGIWLSWPLLAARVLVAPLPFFAFVLPPVVLLAPWWVVAARNRNMMLASRVAAGETFWTPRRARERLKLQSLGWKLGVFALVGFGWRTLVENGELSGLLLGALPQTDWALAALWTLSLVAASLLAARALEAAFARAARGAITLRAAWRLALIQSARLMLGAVGVYALFCVLGLNFRLGAPFVSRLWPTSATSAAFLGAVWGGAALGATMKASARRRWNFIRWLWFWGLALETLARIGRGLVLREPFAFEQAPHVLLSPLVSLAALFRFDLSPSAGVVRAALWPANAGFVAWWLGPLLQVLMGGTCALWAAQIAWGGRVRAEIQNEPIEQKSDWRDLFFWPFRMAWKVLSAIGARIKAAFQALNAWFEQGNDSIVRRGQMRDNAVLTGELRRKVRRANWCRQWAALLVFEVFLFLLLLPWLVISVLSGIGVPQEWGGVVVYAALGIAWLLAGMSVSDGGQAFDRDRANGTLVFLFLTPLSDAAILSGKVLVEFAYAAPIIASAIPWLVLGSLASMATGDFAPPIIALFGAIAVVSTLVFATYLQTMFAARARKPGEGAAKALLVGGAVEAVLVGAFLMAHAYSQFFDFGLNTFEICVGLFVATLAHLALSWLCWKVSLSSLKKERYGDVKSGGKATG